jgi:hypothetical protein
VPTVEPYVAEMLNEIRVLEFSTIAKDGSLNTRPMSVMWSRDTGQILVTVPIGYPQKAFNVRRDDEFTAHLAAAQVFSTQRILSDYNAKAIRLGRNTDAVYPTALARAGAAFDLLENGLGAYTE